LKTPHWILLCLLFSGAAFYVAYDGLFKFEVLMAPIAEEESIYAQRLASLEAENRALKIQVDELNKAALNGDTFYDTTWQCDYCEGTRDGDADVKVAGDLSDCAPGSGCALRFVTDGGKEFTTSCPKCSEKN
jgi:hypothetical protein